MLKDLGTTAVENTEPRWTNGLTLHKASPCVQALAQEEHCSAEYRKSFLLRHFSLTLLAIEWLDVSPAPSLISKSAVCFN